MNYLNDSIEINLTVELTGDQFSDIFAHLAGDYEEEQRKQRDRLRAAWFAARESLIAIQWKLEHMDLSEVAA